MPDLHHSRFDVDSGIEVRSATPREVVAQVVTAERHAGPGGAVHNGLVAALAETVASIGAALAAMERGPTWGAVGLENHTQLLTPVPPGATLVGRAVPLPASEGTQLWEVDVRREEDDLPVARCTVRLLAVDTATLSRG